MAYYKNTTQIPNNLFDTHLKILTGAELKVLLVILRQTLGYIDSTDKTKRKERDWISQRFYMMRTGLSGRTVSSAIASLLSKRLIVVTNTEGNIMRSISLRRASTRLYYASTLVLVSHFQTTSKVLDKKPVNKVHTTKPNLTKLYSDISSLGIQKLSDSERIYQILSHQNANSP